MGPVGTGMAGAETDPAGCEIATLTLPLGPCHSVSPGAWLLGLFKCQVQIPVLGSALPGGLLGDLTVGVVWLGSGALPQGEAAGLVEPGGTAWGQQGGFHCFPLTWGWGP